MLPRVTACALRSASSSPLSAANAEASASRAARTARRSARAAVSAVSTASRASRSPSRARAIAAEASASSTRSTLLALLLPVGLGARRSRELRRRRPGRPGRRGALRREGSVRRNAHERRRGSRIRRRPSGRTVLARDGRKRRGRSSITCAARPCGAGIAARVPSGHASQAASQSSSPGISYSVCGPEPASKRVSAPSAARRISAGGSGLGGWMRSRRVPPGPGNHSTSPGKTDEDDSAISGPHPGRRAGCDGYVVVGTCAQNRDRHGDGHRDRSAGEQRLRNVRRAVLLAQEQLEAVPHRSAQQRIEHDRDTTRDARVQ